MATTPTVRVITVKDTPVSVLGTDYISLTDIAKSQGDARPDDLIRNRIRNRNAIEFLGIWEHMQNPDFKPVEFEGFRNKAGLNSFSLSAKQWIEQTGAIGVAGGIGGFINPQIAISLRLASVNYSTDAFDGLGGTYTRSALFIGPAIQYWVNPNFWLGGGIGYSIDHLSYQNDFGDVGDSVNDPTGIGLSLRAGYTFWSQLRNSVYVQAEYTPGFYGEVNQGGAGNQSVQLNGFAVSIGYQYL